MTLAGDARAFLAAGRMYLRQQRRYPMYFVGLLFWPVMLPASWVLMGQAYSGGDARALSAFADRAGTASVAGFVFIGFAMYMWLSTLLWGPGTTLRQEQVRGSLEAVFLTPASRIVPLFGPGVASLLPLAMTIVIMGVALWVLFGIVPPLDAIVRAAVIVAVGIPSMYAIGTLFAASVLRFGEVGPLVQLIRGMFVLACGITFPIAMLPLWARLWAALLPPTYIVDDLRRVVLRGAELGELAGDLAIVVSLALLTAAASIVVFNALERSARRSGMLGRF